MSTETVMLLIDADNVSVDVMEQAVAWVGRHFGGPHVRRAYCTAESAVKHQALFKRLAIRPMVNLAAGKNSTDIALTVDAVDLAVAERPGVVVIASSDSDFAPLVARLRETGCKVVGIGQQGKTGDETRQAYDDFEVMEHRKAAAPAPRKRSRKAASPASAPAAPAPAPAVAAAVRAAAPVAAKVPAPAPSPAEAEPEADKPARKPRRRRGGSKRKGAALVE